MRDKAGTANARSGLPELKPPGLGMVSFSNFNLQLLQMLHFVNKLLQATVRSQNCCRLLTNCCNLLQSVAKPKETGGDGITFSGPVFSCYPPLTVSASLGVTPFATWPQGDDQTKAIRGGQLNAKSERPQPMESPDAARSCFRRRNKTA
jgi:hypothetical protein